MADDLIIELIDVEIAFGDGRRNAVDKASMSIPCGRFVSLVGQSGSGKTSLLKTINGLVRPRAGAVRVDGRSIADHDLIALRRGVGYVVQEVGLFPHMSVGDNIAVVPRLLGWSKDDIAARVKDLIAMVDLPAEYAERRPGALSGGQKQRIGVARALAARPKIVLMDEPFGALDPLTRDALGRAYRALHEKLRLTTVMVTHDMQEAALLSDRIVVMRDGRIVGDDTPRALLTGAADPGVSDLLNLPKRQAERLHALLGGEAP